jgi:hypothetical protein
MSPKGINFTIITFYDNMVIKYTKLSTITAGIATIAIMAIVGIIGAVGQQQQMASATAYGVPLVDEIRESLREDLEELEDGVIEREICPDQIFVRIPGGYVCIPKFLDDVVVTPG